MKKVLLATILAFVGLAVVTEASARFNRCGAPKCERPCPTRCAQEPSVNVIRVDEKPCGPAPCCLTAVKIPANLVKHVEYSWECPTGCTESNMDGAY